MSRTNWKHGINPTVVIGCAVDFRAFRFWWEIPRKDEAAWQTKKEILILLTAYTSKNLLI